LLHRVYQGEIKNSNKYFPDPSKLIKFDTVLIKADVIRTDPVRDCHLFPAAAGHLLDIRQGGGE
jgi:hypothetical protein